MFFRNHIFDYSVIIDGYNKSQTTWSSTVTTSCNITQCGVVPSKCNLWNIKVPLKKIYGIFGNRSLLQRVILQKEIGKVVLNVVFVVPYRLYNIYSLIVTLLDLFEIPYISHMEFNLLLVFLICLDHGLMVLHESL
jgi:hypothetical protein